MKGHCESGKKCFTKKEAQGAINEIYRNRPGRRRRSRPDYLRSYHCPDCNFYHLTSH